ncbi:hypothetical protein A2368_00040 [Candidatus Collierbacteria bacterium RIFOXYB1_FULL_49_13]|uniref:TNase-like domain-containing protein n=1 Tax=Candidatus Collierbacteria bacterium RIFOXYB1_FULL_49_13 TaxID=1817728 RepID=A0A1F5FFZ5_9BACT|nr:MAG: hypothetical protein A2368_00040 [Candidatus Collierbacteria bacterium RIFOXYB1_FULL_49_13]
MTKVKKSRNVSWAQLLTVILTPSILLNAILLTKQPTPEQGTLVEGVIDGDTLVLAGKTRVRLRQMDAPELEYCGGEEAKKALEELVLNKKVVLSELIPDQRGRGMALVYVGDRLVNEAMLKSGWARFHHDTTSKNEELKQTAKRVESEELGLFAKCQSQDTPDKEGCVVKGNIDPQGGTKRYYVPGCAQYKYTIVEKDLGEAWFCSEKEAVKAGYVKAATCK